MIDDPAVYDNWYRTPRGRWIGDTEYRLLYRLLAPHPGESILDAGCGTGYFARRFGADGHPVVGVDLDPAVATFARHSIDPLMTCLAANLTALPFADDSFDCVIAVTSLGFVADERRAVRELLRVARRRFAIGLLNRRSILFFEKAKRGGSYRDARWHAPREARALLDGLPAANVLLESAVLLPDGGFVARHIEPLVPANALLGAFLAVAGERSGACLAD